MENSLENKEMDSQINSEDEQEEGSSDQNSNESNENHDDNSSQANGLISGLEKKGISKKRRRTKNDQSGRDFKCGCGKTYLSYPALYTHIKEKHDGQIPQGSSKPNTNTKGNRGRPRKTEDNGVFPKNETLSIKAILKSPDSEEAETEIDPIASFPTTNGFFIDDKTYKSILNQIQAIKDSGKGIEDENKNENNLRTTICNKILAYFILDNMAELDQIAFKELCVFTCFYRKALNEHGYEAVEKLLVSWNHPNPTMDRKEEFCEKKEGFYILEVCNDLIEKNLKDYAKTMINQNSLQELRVFKSIDENFRDIVSLFLYFASWLKKNCFTNSRLTLN